MSLTYALDDDSKPDQNTPWTSTSPRMMWYDGATAYSSENTVMARLATIRMWRLPSRSPIAPVMGADTADA